MNRRPVLIALAVALPVAIFIPAKIAASWRPAVVGGGLPFNSVFPPRVTQMRVASNAVLVDNTETDARPYRFDLATGEVNVSRGEGFTVDGMGQWQWIKSAPPQIAIGRGGATESYAVPTEIPVVSPMIVGFYVTPERIEFLSVNRHLRWDKGARAPKRDVKFAGSFWDNTALTRDGETMVSVAPTRILRYSTRDGHVTGRTPMANVSPDFRRAAWVSAFGRYGCYELNSRRSSLRRGEVWDAIGGRKLWNFERQDDAPTALSLDEKQLAIANRAERVWHVYDLPTGALLRTLALVPDAQAGAFSPDGATLYSVAGGKLYRQRAR